MVTTSTPVQVGEVVADKYRIDRVLGMGGMGVVMAATHLQLEQRVALKFMRPDVLDSKDAVARFLREARAVVRLKSEHVARVLDVGTLEGSPYIVMEHLEGQDLGALERERGPLPVSDAVDFVVQASEAIAEAHALGIVHRDLKPANLFLTRRADGSALIKVLDFGISKTTMSASAGPGPSLTDPGAMLGSPLYMSPEQLRSTPAIDPRADMWALGVILYQLVAGRAPFEAETLPQLCMKVMQDDPPPLGDLRHDLPAGFEAVILRCLQKNRDDRYANLADMAAALAPFGPPGAQVLAGRVAGFLRVPAVTPSSPPPLRSAAARFMDSTVASGESSGLHPKSRRPLLWAAIISLAVVAALVVYLSRGRSAGSPAAPAPRPAVAVDAAVPSDAAVVVDAATPSVDAAPARAPDAGLKHRKKPPVGGDLYDHQK